MRDDDLSHLEGLSALADGEADPQAAVAACSRWRDDAQWRARWHSYQLIGDALRSDELGGRGRDAAFLQGLRARLEREPVMLAPHPVVADAPRRGGARRWATPAAVAAGFALVAGALTVTRLAEVEPAPELAQAPATAASVAAVAAALAGPASGAEFETIEVAQGALLRDARMVEYLEAHRQFGGSTALGVPSGFLRGATYQATPSPAAR